MMESYRGDGEAIRKAAEQHKAHTGELAKVLARAAESLRRACQSHLGNNAYKLAGLDFSTAAAELAESIIADEELTLARSRELRDLFEQPVPALSALLEPYQAQWEQARKAFAALDKQAQTTDANKTHKKKLDAQGKQLKALSLAIKAYFENAGDDLKNLKQAVRDWRMLGEYFPDGVYRDVEGLCKIVDLAEVIENDYSLTPGRYVGYRIDIDEDFDYQKRLAEIHTELSELTQSANTLLTAIKGVNL